MSWNPCAMTYTCYGKAAGQSPLSRHLSADYDVAVRLKRRSGATSTTWETRRLCSKLVGNRSLPSLVHRKQWNLTCAKDIALGKAHSAVSEIETGPPIDEVSSVPHHSSLLRPVLDGICRQWDCSLSCPPRFRPPQHPATQVTRSYCMDSIRTASCRRH